MRSCVVLCSGGIDSVTTAAWLRHQRWAVHLVHINYGQVTATAECNAVERCAVEMDLSSTALVKVPQIGEWGRGSLVGGKETGVAGEHFPNRNLLLLGIGAVIASSYAARAVALGVLDSENAYYADCRPEFLNTCSEMLKSLSPPLTLLLPLALMTKLQVVQHAIELNVPLGLTFSCNCRSDRHCWKCTSCIERQAAFEAAGVAL